MGLFEIVLLAVFAYLLFGTNKTAEFFRSVKKSTKNFKESRDEIEVDPKDIHDLNKKK